MKYSSCVLILVFVLCGCAATKMVLVNPQKTAQEIKSDEEQCNLSMDVSDYKDASLREKKFNQCMKKKGYKLVPEKEAGRVKGFKEVWVNPDIDFKGYEVIFIDKVDVSQVKVKNMQIAGTQVTNEDIDKLGEEMQERFSRTLNILIPVVQDKEKIAGKRALLISLKIKDIAQTNIGFNTALQVAGEVSRLPVPGGSRGIFSLEALITDFSNGVKLITLSDESKSDKNASLVGLENFERWKHAYNTMDYWADCLAELLAAKRGQKYKSQLKLKIIDF